MRNGLLEGIRYVLNTPLLLGLFALNAMPAMLIMPSVNGLMPVYAAEVFEVDARGLGLLVSAFGAGSTLGTFALASLGDIKAKGIALICGIIITAVTTLIFSVNAFFPTAYLNLMIISAAMMMYFSVTSAVVQGTVPDEYRGRVTGLYMITWGAVPAGQSSRRMARREPGSPGGYADYLRRNVATSGFRGLEVPSALADAIAPASSLLDAINR